MKTSLKQLEMHKEFIPYEEALAMKELGFKEPCLKYYFEDRMLCKGFALMNWNNQNGCFNAPLYQQAFRWFREKGIYGDITTDLSDNLEDRVFVYYIYSKTGCYFVDRSEEHKTYEKAQVDCLKKLIEIVKQKKEDE